MSQEHQELVRHVAQAGNLTHEKAVVVADEMRHLSAMHLKLTEMSNNFGLTGEQAAAQDAIEQKIRDLTSDLPGVQGVAFWYDPRGATVKIKLKSGASNSLTGYWNVILEDGATKSLTANFWKPYANKQQASASTL